MITLSAPAMSGYRGEFNTTSEARSKAAEILGITTEAMIEVESPDGGTTYCYRSEEEAGADRDGAYAVQYSGEPEED